MTHEGLLGGQAVDQRVPRLLTDLRDRRHRAHDLLARHLAHGLAEGLDVLGARALGERDRSRTPEARVIQHEQELGDPCFRDARRVDLATDGRAR